MSIFYMHEYELLDIFQRPLSSKKYATGTKSLYFRYKDEKALIIKN